MKYRRRASEIVEAIQYDGTNFAEIDRFPGVRDWTHYNGQRISIDINETDGFVVAIGDWLVMSDGKLRGHTNDDFWRIYEPAKDL